MESSRIRRSGIKHCGNRQGFGDWVMNASKISALNSTGNLQGFGALSSNRQGFGAWAERGEVKSMTYLKALKTLDKNVGASEVRPKFGAKPLAPTDARSNTRCDPNENNRKLRLKRSCARSASEVGKQNRGRQGTCEATHDVTQTKTMENIE